MLTLTIKNKLSNSLCNQDNRTFLTVIVFSGKGKRSKDFKTRKEQKRKKKEKKNNKKNLLKIKEKKLEKSKFLNADWEHPKLSGDGL